MTKADLIEEVSKMVELTRKDSEVVVDTIFDSIVHSLRSGDKIEIRGFGSFRTPQRKPRAGRNPKTGERRPQFSLPGRPRRKKEQRTLHTNGVRLEPRQKPPPGKIKLPFNFRPPPPPHAETPTANTGPNRSQKLLRVTAKMHAHGAHAFFNNTCQCTAPPGMEGPHGFIRRVGNQDRQTVGSLNTEHEAGLFGHHSITS